MKNTLSKIIFLKKAFLWDFDGCVCNSEEIHYEAYAKAFRYFGHEVNKNEYFETFTHTGGGIAKEMENYHLTYPPEEIKRLKAQYYSEFLNSGHAKLFPEIEKIILCLKLSGIKNVIASNSPRFEIETVLVQSNAEHLFDNIIGLEKNLQKKPAPDIFLKALSVLAVKPEEAMVVEDSERGLLAAQAAGCDALWIQTDINAHFNSRAPYLTKLPHKELLRMCTQFAFANSN